MMYKLCKTEQSAMRQRQLEQGLLRAMLAQQYEDISVSDLCDQMGIPRKSFYRYFTSKDGALFALLDHTLMEFQDTPIRATKGRKGSALGDLERYFDFWYQRKTLLDALAKSRLSGMLVERATAHAQNERLMPSYLLSMAPGIQSMALTFAICGLLSMVTQWHYGGFQETPEEMARIATRMLVQPLIPMP